MSNQEIIQEAVDLCETMGQSLTAIDTASKNLDDAITSGATFESGDIYQLFHVIKIKLETDQQRLEELLDTLL